MMRMENEIITVSTPLLNTTKQIYDTFEKETEKKHEKPKEKVQEKPKDKCKLDADGIPATCAAYTCETTAIVGTTALKGCASFNPVWGIPAIIATSIVAGISTFFCSRKLINKFNNSESPGQSQQAQAKKK